MINVGIGYDEMPESSRVYSADTWAWESDKAIETYCKEIMMSKLSFDKKTFNWGYGFVYTFQSRS